MSKELDQDLDPNMMYLPLPPTHNLLLHKHAAVPESREGLI